MAKTGLRQASWLWKFIPCAMQCCMYTHWGWALGRCHPPVIGLSPACDPSVTPLSPVLSPYCHPTVTLLSPYCHPDADTLLPHSGLPVMKGEKIFFCCKLGCVYSLIGPSLQKQCFTNKSACYGRHKACAAGFCYVTLTAAQDKGCTLVQSKGGRPSVLTVPEGVQLSVLATKVLDAYQVLLATRG